VRFPRGCYMGEVPEFVDWIECRKIVNLCFGRRSWVENESELGRFKVLRGGSGGQEVCFLMGSKNFEVPGAADIEISRKVDKVIRS
jgi:hypothetical protein